MRRGIVAVIVLSVCLFAFQKSSFAEPEFRVKIDISGNDSIKDEVQSYVNRELRSLGDVVITDNNSQYTLQITCIDNSPTYVAMAYVVIVPLDIESLAEVLSSNAISELGMYIGVPHAEYLEGEIRNRFEMDLRDYERHGYSSVIAFQARPPEGLREICEGIVSQFDVGYLEPRRKTHQRFLDSLKNEKPEDKAPSPRAQED